ncbi:uncharacterized protein LOC114839747 isoform X2 [Esox lucius]|nr:uncharacterized protein LOC114839747 isoform X2 [Esox lucius]XP_034150140.1 uncharacterized protein LOC114839747 isoform X2 [Esox lucius]
MVLKTAGCLLVAFLCSVKGVHCRNCLNETYAHQRICALKGSTVDLPCKYIHLDNDTVSDSNLYIQGKRDEAPTNLSSLPEYSGRVKYLGNNVSDCTLRITDLRETDSAEYKFRFKTQNGEWGYSFPGTNLTVTDLQVKVTPGTGGNHTKTLTCSTSCNLTDNSNLTYVWYMNGQRLDKPVSHQHSVKEYYINSYSCSLLNLRSAVVCVVGQSCMNVSYTHQSVCALKGSTVNISCTFSHPNRQNVTEKTWFNKWDSGVIHDLIQNPEYAGRVEYHRTTDKDSTLTVTDLRESDSAEYKFRFTSNKVTWGYSFPGTTLTVTDLQVKVTPGTGGNHTKTLTCSTSCNLTDNSNLTYVWYMNGQRLDKPVSHQHSVKEYYINSYSCSLLNLRSAVVCVVGQSCMNVSYTRQSVCALKGSTVNISCTFSHLKKLNATEEAWFNKWDSGVIIDLNQDPEYAGRVEYHRTTDKDSTLTVKDLRETDSAEYKFRFTTNKVTWGYSFPGTTLTVTDLQVRVTPGTGGKTLTCSTSCNLTDNSNLTYVWYKNGQRLDEPVSRQHSVKEYYTDSYSCSLLNLRSAVACVVGQSCMNVSYTHQSVCALKGSTVNISCTFSHLKKLNTTEEAWFNKWDSGVIIDLNQDPEYAGRVEYHRTTDKDSTLTVTDLRESDSAEYKFRFTSNKVTWGYSFPGTTLTVTDLQVKVTPGTRWNQTRTLTCSTSCNLTDNSNLTYVWYKNGQRLDEPVSRQHSVKEYYTDSYSCSLLNLRSAMVCVVGQSCMNVSYTHQSVCALKGSTVNISCTFRHLKNHNATEETWFNKWDSGVIIDLNQDPEYAGRVEYHQTTDKDSTLTVTDLRESDSAEYKFRFTSNKVTWGYSFPGTTLTVTDIQVKVTPATEEGKVNLTCITSCPLTDNSNTTYIWYKNGQHLTHQKTMTNYLILDPDSMEDRGRYSCGVKGLTNVHSPEFSVGEQRVTTGVIVGITVVVVILILCLSGFIWFSKKASKSTSDGPNTAVIGQTDSNPVYSNVSDMALTSTAAQTADTDHQFLLHYSSFHFSSSKKQEVSLYSTLQTLHPQKQEVPLYSTVQTFHP